MWVIPAGTKPSSVAGSAILLLAFAVTAVSLISPTRLLGLYKDFYCSRLMHQRLDCSAGLEAEFYSYAAYGVGIYALDSSLVGETRILADRAKAS